MTVKIFRIFRSFSLLFFVVANFFGYFRRRHSSSSSDRRIDHPSSVASLAQDTAVLAPG